MTEGYAPEWLALEAAMGGQGPALTGDLDSMVAQYNSIGAMLVAQWGPLPDAVQARDEKINENVAVRIYAPKEASSTKLPVGLYYHGGGYAYENFAKRNGDPSRYFVIGGSGGGGLALRVADKIIQDGKRDIIHGIVAINPITCHFDNPPTKYKDIYTSYTEHRTGAPFIDIHCLEAVFEATNAQPTDATIFVILSPHLSSYPRVYLVTCEKDILGDDGIVLEHLLCDAGATVKLDHYERYPHYFFVFPSLEMSRTNLSNVVQGINFVLGVA